jgi:hypothetical protein
LRSTSRFCFEGVDQRDHSRAIDPDTLGQALLQRWPIRLNETEDGQQASIELEPREGRLLDRLITELALPRLRAAPFRARVGKISHGRR